MKASSCASLAPASCQTVLEAWAKGPLKCCARSAVDRHPQLRCGTGIDLALHGATADRIEAEIEMQSLGIDGLRFDPLRQRLRRLGAMAAGIEPEIYRIDADVAEETPHAFPVERREPEAMGAGRLGEDEVKPVSRHD